MNGSLMNWIDPSNTNWLFDADKILGIGEGIGSHSVSYAFIDTDCPILNGSTAVDLFLPSLDCGFAAGLVCRADYGWSFVAGYLVRNPAKSLSAIMIGVCRSGTFAPVHGTQLASPLGAGHHQLSLRFFSGSIGVTVVSDAGKSAFEHVVPDLPFPGRVGVVKLYGTRAEMYNFRFTIINDPFREVHKPMFKYDVFISYSSKDETVVDKIVLQFKKNGVTYWLDAEQIGLGQSITKQIEEGIQASKHVLVCLSSNLGKSNWCRAEYASVLHQYFSGNTNRRVIPLKLDAVSDSDIPPLLYDLRRADYGNKQEFEELVRYLKT